MLALGVCLLKSQTKDLPSFHEYTYSTQISFCSYFSSIESISIISNYFSNCPEAYLPCSFAFTFYLLFLVPLCFKFSPKAMFPLILERERWREEEREKHQSAASCVYSIRYRTCQPFLWCIGRQSNQVSHMARASSSCSLSVPSLLKFQFIPPSGVLKV